MNQKSAVPPEYSRFVLNIFEEGHNVFWESQEDNFTSRELGPHPLTQIASQQREMLMSSMLVTQFPDKVMSTYKNNCAIRISGNITEIRNQREMASTLGLDDEKAIGKLEKQFWIVSVAGCGKPFLMKTPDIQKPAIAEADILSQSRPFLSALEMKRRETEARLFMVQVEKKSEVAHLPELSKEGWLLLDYVFWHEWSYQQKVTEALALSDRKFARAKQELLDRKLISIQKFPVKVHDRIHFALTPNALEVMKILNRPAQRIGYWKWIIGVPGYEHKFWQNMLRAKHRILGWTGRIEHDLKDGRRVDLYEEKDGYRKAIEIEISTKDVENKVRVLTDREVEELILLYKDETHLHFARSKLEKMENIPKEKIWIGVIRDYVDILDNIIKGPETSGDIGKTSPNATDDGQKRKHGGNIGEIG